MGSACHYTSNTSNKILKPVFHPNQLIPFSRYSNLNKQYKYISTIYKGSFSIVKLYQEVFTDKDYFVVKTSEKLEMTKLYYECLVTEVAHLRKFDHPNIVNYINIFEDEETVNLVLEYSKGRDLYDHYKEVILYPEAKKCDLMFQVLSGLCYFHKADIYHRDIKLENIIVTLIESSNSLVVKLIDFEFATKEREEGRIGSLHYLSPEMINSKGGAKSDIWSLGVVLYCILSGVFPFDANEKEKLYEIIQTKPYNSEPLDEIKCSEEVRDLLDKMLEKDEEKRPNCFEVIEHPWFKKHITFESTEDFFTDNSFFELIDTFKEFSIVKKFLIMFYVKYINTESLLHLNKLFYALDPNHLGVLKKDHLIKEFGNYGIKTNLADIDSIQEEMFETIEDRISYSLYISIMISKTISEYAVNQTSLRLLFISFTFPQNVNIITEHSFIISIKNLADMKINEAQIRYYFDSKYQLTYNDFIHELDLMSQLK